MININNIDLANSITHTIRAILTYADLIEVDLDSIILDATTRPYTHDAALDAAPYNHLIDALLALTTDIDPELLISAIYAEVD
jgi:hypothetical protein